MRGMHEEPLCGYENTVVYESSRAALKLLTQHEDSLCEYESMRGMHEEPLRGYENTVVYESSIAARRRFAHR